MKKPGKIVLLLAAGLLVLIGAAALLRRSPGAARTGGQAPTQETESAFIGRSGYIVRLPKGYAAVSGFKDDAKNRETVYFCRAGTDPVHFLNEGLFAQLGIVRLDVQPNSLAGDPDDLGVLSQWVSRRLRARGDKFAVKNIQISSLRGIQVTTELPNPGVEAFILGKSSLYRFTAGQVDEIYLDIVNSLRDPQSE